MKVNTKYLNEVEIDSDQIIIFPEGLPAFENERRFIIIPFDQDSPFFYLQSVGNAQLCFILADMFTFFPDFELKIDPREIESLQVEADDQVSLNVFALLTIPHVFADTTANLLAPLIINFEQRIGMQIIPQTSQYNTKHPLFPEVLSPAEGGSR